ncbi:hypothetical protein D3C75_273100 [compost metagenome]
MATVSSTVKMMDQFSRPLQRISSQVVETTARMERLKRVMESPVTLKLNVAGMEDITMPAIRIAVNQSILRQQVNAARDYIERNLQDIGAGIRIEVPASLRMTFGNLERMVTRLVEAMDRLQRRTRTDTSQAGQLEAALRRIAALEQRIAHLQDHTNSQMQHATGHAQSWMDKLQGIAAGYYLIQGLLQGIFGIMETMDTYINTQARLDLINDKLQTTAELQEKIFRSAERARGSYTDMAAVIGRMGTLAGDAFKSNDELIAFTELMQKSFRIGGSGTMEQQAGMYQLSQAMAAGKLQGDEFRSIMENAPMLAQAIADVTGKTKGELKKMSADGVITSDIIKAAMFNAADKINQKFASMPLTFSDVMNDLKNTALQSFGPLIERINDMLNSPGGAAFIENLKSGIASAAETVNNLLTASIALYSFISGNWTMIEPVIWGVVAALAAWKTATFILNTIMGIQSMISAIAAARTALLAGTTWTEVAAQWGLNAALLACPITWIILGIIALIAIFYLVIAAINKFAGTSLSATGMIAGAFTTVGAVIGNIFLGLLQLVFGIIEYWYNWFAAIANFLGNVFNDPIGAVINLFADLADNVLGVLQRIASAMDFIFGSHMADTVAGWRDDLGGMAQKAVQEYGNGKYEDKVKDLDLDTVLDDLGVNFERFNYGDAYNSGYEWGANLFGSDENGAEKEGEKAGKKEDSYTQVPPGTATTATIPNVDKVGELGKIKDTVDISSEDLKVLRELAEMKNIQNFVTLTPTVQVKTGPVNNGYDVDTIVNRIEERLTEQIASSAQGVYG